MIASPTEARDQIFGVFKGAWNPQYPVSWRDVPSAPPVDEVPWARIRLEHVTGVQSSINGEVGCRRYDSTGFVSVQIFCPIGDGQVTAYGLAKQVQQAYQDARLSVWFRNVRIREATPSGNFEQMNVIADFEYETVR